MDTRTKTVVMAGGEGKRLRPLSYYVQKVMIPLGENEKPLLEYIVRILKYNGFRDILVLVGYKGYQVINYFGDGSRFGVRMEYSFDDNTFKGSGGALLKAYINGFFDDTDDILVYYGDMLGDFDLAGLKKFFVQSGSDVTLLVTKRYHVPVGVAKIGENDRVISLVEKPWLDINATLGILMLRSSVLEELRNIDRKDTDLMGDVIPYLINKGYKVTAYYHYKEWYDIGSIERYEKINNKWLATLTKKYF